MSILLRLIVGLSIFYSCGKQDDQTPFKFDDDDEKIIIASSRHQPGIGSSTDYPQGKPLKLPDGIRIVERKDYPFNPDLRKLYAHANFFYVDVNLVNDKMPGTPPIIVEFPPGIIVVSQDHDKQNGLSFGRYLIEVPPTKKIGGGRDTTTIYIGMACLNQTRSMPWYDNQGFEQRYPISRNNFKDFLITTDPNLLHFLDYVQSHQKLKVNRHWDPVEAHEPDYETPEWFIIHNKVQELFWQITDGFGIKQKELKDLLALLK